MQKLKEWLFHIKKSSLQVLFTTSAGNYKVPRLHVMYAQIQIKSTEAHHCMFCNLQNEGM